MIMKKPKRRPLPTYDVEIEDGKPHGNDWRVISAAVLGLGAAHVVARIEARKGLGRIRVVNCRVKDSVRWGNNKWFESMRNK